ncbi:MAG: branched-chain amino acid ABC transporter permease, partial [Reyranella sp.]
SAVAGAYVGRLIRDPRAWGFDFAFIAIFIGLIVGFRTRPGFVVTVMASAGAATLVHLIQPGPLSIAVGAAAGILAAAIAVEPAGARR